MTKMIKLSLVAAVAVAGFTTTVSANDLKISGGMAYKLDKVDTADTWGHYYKTSIVMKKAINDKITAAVSYAASTQDRTARNGAPAGMSNAKFMYKSGGTHVVLGRQGVTTPWTNGSSAIDGTNVGNGIIASHHIGGVTLVGAHIANHNLGLGGTTASNNNNLTVLAAIAKVGPAKLQLWNLNVATSATSTFEASATTIVADATVKAVKLGLRHSMAEINNGDTQTLTTISAKMKAGKVSINAGIAMGGEDGSNVAFDAAGNAGNQQYLGTWNLSLGGAGGERTLMALGATMPLTNTLTGTVNFGTRNTKGATSAMDTDETELKLHVAAKVAKNTTAYLRHAVMGGDATFDSRTRLYLAYKF